MPDSYSKYAAVTIVSMRYLALARVTGKSFKQHHPDVDFYILLADQPAEQMFEPDDAMFRFLNVNELKLDDAESVFFKYAELELSYALTPSVIKHLLNLGYEGVIFLKQETLVLGELNSIAAYFADKSVLLTPHLLEPIARKDGETWELNVLLAGIFNGGFIGFSHHREARVFLDWWESKTLFQCFNDVASGLHFEQHWLDFVPSFVQSYLIIRDPGVNVGHWNLQERDVRVHDGKVTAKGMPCRIFRFSGYDSKTPDLLTKYNKQLSLDFIGDAALVVRIYQKMLAEAGYEATNCLSYAFDRFDNGVEITQETRRVYRALGTSAARFGNPFQTSHANSFYHWLNTDVVHPDVE